MFQFQSIPFWNWGIFLLISIILQVNHVYSVAEDYSIVPSDDGMSNFVQSSDGSWGRILDENEQDNNYFPPLLSPHEFLPGVKRHLGSVAALSGSRGALQQFNSITHGIGNEIRPRGLFKKKGMYLPPLLRKFYLYDHENTAEIPSPNQGNGIPVKEFWMDNAVDEDSLQSQDAGEGEPKTSQVFYDQPFQNLDGNARRTLARGGWFPRQFRGFVAEPTWEKRHLGAVARFGWVPHAKNFRDRDADLKRNLSAFRKIQSGNGKVGSSFSELRGKGQES